MLPFSANSKQFYNASGPNAEKDRGSIQVDGYICSWKELEPVTSEKFLNEVHITNPAMRACFWSVNNTVHIENQENTIMIQKQTETSYGLSNEYDKEYSGEDQINLALVNMGNMIWKSEHQTYEERNIIAVPSVLDISIWKSDDAIQIKDGIEQIHVVLSHLKVSSW